MAGGAPQISQLRSEILRAESQKSNVEAQRESMLKALSQMEGSKAAIDNAIGQVRDRLAGNIPPEARKQLMDQLSKFSADRKTLVSRIAQIKEGLANVKEAIGGLKSGIAARKNALQRIAGQLTRMPMYNREMGTKKG
ncbi:MAG: hypothetical protein QY330_02020 [Candidatus Dojkabacteria bacterium]|uniref:Uncharacterized protein n=2 Tax=Candidatus Dojkabacteria TaxID=74243 RepID=A0A136KJL1_9BACT|nr:MAG: hypothetical protein UZ20_WS6002000398 [candidate division WS6 bacterium OLB21]MBW7953217.1 hypothetical protein [Candidatus Dojkabacteria bacterium]WKZ28363.1 MAG: hypothetical protein QY330_02020 [Candidatus Dojkabacteria bacterium]